MFDEDNEELQKSSLSRSKTTTLSEKHSSSEAFAVSTSEFKPSKGAMDVEMSLIDVNPKQPRRTFEEISELADSIRTHGVLQPLLLTKVGSRYMIIAGERRFRAAQQAGLKTVPALLRSYTPKQIAEIALVENLQRADLNEIEIATGIRSLMDTHFMTQEQVASVLGLSRSSIANSLRLLVLPKEVQQLLEQKLITMGHAKCLGIIPDAKICVDLARRCAEGKMTVRDLEDYIKYKLQNPSKQTPLPPQSIELKDLARQLTQILGTRVLIQGTAARGKLVIEYHARAELEFIRSKIK